MTHSACRQRLSAELLMVSCFGLCSKNLKNGSSGEELQGRNLALISHLTELSQGRHSDNKIRIMSCVQVEVKLKVGNYSLLTGFLYLH